MLRLTQAPNIAIAALWVGHVVGPDTAVSARAPEPSTSTDSAPAAATQAPSPEPATQAGELAREAAPEAPTPAATGRTAKPRKRTLAKRAARKAPPAKPEIEAVPAAPDEGHEDGWVIRRR